MTTIEATLKSPRQARGALPSTPPLLERVSLTGPDDRTPVASLARLAHAHPFVEWALLYYPEKEGAPRNPTAGWRNEFFAASMPGTAAVHLCGKQAFEELLSGTLPREILKAQRLQLNVNARGPTFSANETFEIYTRALLLGPALILQRHDGTALAIEVFLDSLLESQRPEVHVLLDESKGRGVMPEAWDVPEVLDEYFCGFAGGIGPANVADVAVAADELRRPYWLDMESGLRTDNRFDLQRAEQVLRAVAAHRS